MKITPSTRVVCYSESPHPIFWTPATKFYCGTSSTTKTVTKRTLNMCMGWEKKDLGFLTNIRGYFPKVYNNSQLQIRKYDMFLQLMLSDNHLMILEY